MMRILLRGNGNVNQEHKAATNAIAVISSEGSLTISYHAICVNTHINLFLHSQLADKQKRLMMNVTQINIYLYM